MIFLAAPKLPGNSKSQHYYNNKDTAVQSLKISFYEDFLNLFEVYVYNNLFIIVDISKWATLFCIKSRDCYRQELFFIEKRPQI